MRSLTLSWQSQSPPRSVLRAHFHTFSMFLVIFWGIFMRKPILHRFFMQFACKLFKNAQFHQAKTMKNRRKTKVFWRFSKIVHCQHFSSNFLSDCLFFIKKCFQNHDFWANRLPCGVKVAPRVPMGGHGGHPGADFNVLGEPLAALQGYLGRYLDVVGWHLSLRIWILRILELPSSISDVCLIDFQWKK